MHSLTIKQVKSPLQQKNELAFLQTHSRTKPRDTLLFFVFCFVMTDQWSHSPHSFQRVQRCECEHVYVHRRACDHMSPTSQVWVIRGIFIRLAESFATRTSSMKRTAETEMAPQEYVAQCEGASQSRRRKASRLWWWWWLHHILWSHMHLKQRNCLPTAWWPITSQIDLAWHSAQSVAKIKGFI